MDELDLLKKDWNKEKEESKLSAKDIYPMLLKKSSSIVKTLFYISIAELIFWTLVNVLPFFLSETYRTQLDHVYTNKTILALLNFFSYAVILLFIYLLYKSYKSISVTDNAKKLMESIIKTRKITKYYVLYNLVVAFLAMVVGLYFGIQQNPDISNKLAQAGSTETFIIYASIVSFTAIFIVLLWLFYRLIYGLLLKRLNRNYKELKKLEF
ncbi:hypothetical protein [Algibacter mikhailovii]|uniref:Beta-carotene 15,15'-monooxygenase n=1 Tax=Algibacter mikhailovii TaxID=425498 RepID=A0A918VB50_9FLAO|nr:hypothetical protein [Algibacter mikhailovii]GGZ83291.1 hypothetical protein GCM10007028_21550 [Algibacter mikhailovii]